MKSKDTGWCDYNMDCLENSSVIPTFDTGWETVNEIFAERAKREREIASSFPLVNVVYNYIVAVSVVALIASLFWWAVDIHYQRQADAQTEAVLASYQAEQKAVADAAEEERALAAQSEEAVVDRMAEALAKLFYGVNKFKAKYGYSDVDFYTLARCVFNRVENSAYSNDIFEVIDQTDQWVGYFSTNPVLREYKELALTSIREWRSESVKPIGNDYLWAELTPNGIFLKNDFHADGYAMRWRYQ